MFLQADEAVAKAGQIVEKVAQGDTSDLNALLQQGLGWAVEAGKCIIMALLIYIVGKFLINIIMRVMTSMLQRRKVDTTIQSFLRSFVKILLQILLLITVVSALGVNTTSFAALLASAGVAIGMALSGNLQNLAGGLIVLAFKPFRVGDYIEAQGTSGTVKEIQIFHTILTTVDNKEVYIPNGALSSGTVTNYSRNDLRRVDLTIGVEYNTDLEKVRNVLTDLFAQDDRVLQDPAPFIALGELADSSVNLTVRVWTKSVNYWDVFFQSQERIYDEFNKQGISFPFPQVTIHKA